MASSIAPPPALLPRPGGWPRPRWRDKWRALFAGAAGLRLGALPEQLGALYGARPALLFEAPLAAPWHADAELSHADLARLTAVGVPRAASRAKFSGTSTMPAICPLASAVRASPTVAALPAMRTDGTADNRETMLRDIGLASRSTTTSGTWRTACVA